MYSPDGGMTVTPRMRELISRSGKLKSMEGGQELRDLYRAGSIDMDPFKFSRFGFHVFTGTLELVKEDVENGTAPDLAGYETAYQTSYASLVALGSQRFRDGPPQSGKHLETLKYLLSKGLPPDGEDIVGYTAVHHLASSPEPRDELLRCLLENGANVDHQNRYGEASSVASVSDNRIDTHGYVGSADGSYDAQYDPNYRYFNGVQRVPGYPRGRRDHSSSSFLGLWSTSDGGGNQVDQKAEQVARYCSVDCQRSAWPTHKRTCNPFSHSNTVVLIPHYHAYNNTIPTADLTRRAMGYPSEAEAWSKNKMRGAHAPKKVDKESKSITIKVQVPWNFQGDLEASKKSSGDLLVYTKKRDFACTIRKRDAPAEYDRIAAVVREKGVGGAKAYFAAELESRDRLVVKVTEVLAEQPW
ncbi:unnamed protein product [Mycena citricolor]|uniref:MYND-type domain-containing protein n=1 Tax=Mycena citricolor TaxID=2018698 RepID=A0AAD2JV48_9AGAR|nr:unnamed protein product [Mycena citricolor]